MELGKHAVDKGLLDRNGRRCGKVDDLLLELPNPGEDGRLLEPEVVSILTGPMALASHWPSRLQWLARLIYHVLGVPDPQPACIPWSAVDTIDVVVHLNVDREEAGLNVLANAVRRRIISRIPGA